MNFKLYQGITSEKLIKVIPAKYKSLISKVPLIGISDIVIFPVDKVILSNKIKKALGSLGEDTNNRKIFIGYNFTAEAKEIMSDNNIDFIEFHSFNWTDESYTNIRQNI